MKYDMQQNHFSQVICGCYPILYKVERKHKETPAYPLQAYRRSLAELTIGPEEKSVTLLQYLVTQGYVQP